VGRKRWTSRKRVEDCAVSLSIVWLHRLARLFNRAPGDTVWLTLPNPLSGEPLARIECQYTFREPYGLVILVRAEDAQGTALCYRNVVPIVTTRPHFGGERYWFRCDCRERVGRLYLPEGKHEFLCRECLNLTYRSAQRHDTRLYAMAKDQEAIDLALCSGVHQKALRGVNAFALRLKWMQRGRYDLLKWGRVKPGLGNSDSAALARRTVKPRDPFQCLPQASESIGITPVCGGI
jgi:hypothetical protein